ncbi:hypothetical protein GCM10012275_32120 [Longimycelium tulufanense]|uniref:Barstar (barnase inhibitor) domain-containing protein n=1 Tax=Longimycelium tulufanense TaxID=907463 RepID=A0A8J3C979_9PSEU|nr:hypothetical protein GCM10012275_32120 [Longimycelium tulufanense]
MGGGGREQDSRIISSDHDLDEWTFTLTGFTPVPPFQSPGGEGGAAGTALDSLEVQVLGGHGEVLGAYSAWNAELTRLDEDRRQITCATALLPHRDAQPVWELWRQGGPQQKNLWTELPSGRRAGWLQVVALSAFATSGAARPKTPTSEIVLNGEHIVDLDSFYLAIGEAVNGPGGYFGWNLDSLTDCLHGGWGARAAPRIRWENFTDTQRHLTQSTLDSLLSVISDRTSEVELR